MGEVNDMKQPTLTRGAVAKIDQIDFVRLCVYTIRLCELLGSTSYFMEHPFVCYGLRRNMICYSLDSQA